MLDVQVCIACFSTECKLYDTSNNTQLEKQFCLISGIKANDLSGLPHYLCVECAGYVTRFWKFREKCQRAYFAYKELLKTDKQVNKLNITLINQKALGVNPTLSYLDLEKTFYETIKFKWDKDSRTCFNSPDKIPVFRCSTLDSQNDFEDSRKKAKLIVESIKEETVNNYEVSIDEVPVQWPDNTNDEISFEDGNVDDSDDDTYVSPKDKDKDVDGSKLEQEYATLVPLSMKEAQAAFEVTNMYSKSKNCCNICGKSFSNDDRYKAHLRMHDKLFSGTFKCELCLVYYKTDFLLKTHMTEKHMYKYLCRRCDEVNFDRASAKQHFVLVHLRRNTNSYYSRPAWMTNKGGYHKKNYLKILPTKKKPKRLPSDFLTYSPITQEEQYQLVLDRKTSRNYIESNFKCELCYKGFRFAKTFGTHMKKHDPSKSGKLQCDMCKQHFPNARKAYRHMVTTHLSKFSCQICGYVCFNKSQAHSHYKFHKDVTYNCPHCDRTFTKMSTKLTHIRIKHPSNYICTICGHSFVSQSGLYCHKKFAHTAEEIEASEAPDGAVAGAAEGAVDGALAGAAGSGRRCDECALLFLSEAAYLTHLGSSPIHAATNLSFKSTMKHAPRGEGGAEGRGASRRRGRPRNDIVNTGVAVASYCELCQKPLANDVQARRHYEAEHPGHDFLKRYMCDVCGHTTRQYANLMVHMRTHTNEKPYGCPHCDRRFSMPSNRDRHIVVHTGERKYQCQHCNRRFTQSSAVKLHIQTVHLKIPYAPWDKKNRKRRKELEGAATTLSAAPLPPLPKLMLDNQDYLNAYITYNE